MLSLLWILLVVNRSIVFIHCETFCWLKFNVNLFSVDLLSALL
jgi:hypothetical protein